MGFVVEWRGGREGGVVVLVWGVVIFLRCLSTFYRCWSYIVVSSIQLFFAEFGQTMTDRRYMYTLVDS